MNIHTKRLHLRGFLASDYLDLYEYLSDPETVRYEPYEPYSLIQCKRLAAKRVYDDSFIAVCLGKGGKMIGNLYLEKSEDGSYELGYIINPLYRRKGYAEEASLALMSYCFIELGAREVFARCCTENTASYSLMEKLGMHKSAFLPRHMFFGKRKLGLKVYEDVFEYTIGKAEFAAKRSLPQSRVCRKDEFGTK